VLRTVRYYWNRFGPIFAATIRKRRIYHRSFSQWRWHPDEVFVGISGETHYLWRAVDHEGEVQSKYPAGAEKRSVDLDKSRQSRRLGYPKRHKPGKPG